MDGVHWHLRTWMLGVICSEGFQGSVTGPVTLVDYRIGTSHWLHSLLLLQLMLECCSFTVHVCCGFCLCFSRACIYIHIYVCWKLVLLWKCISVVFMAYSLFEFQHQSSVMDIWSSRVNYALQDWKQQHRHCNFYLMTLDGVNHH